MPELGEFLAEDMDGRDALLTKFGGEDGVSRMAKSYLELESFRGRSVALPKDGADDDEWRTTMQKFGAPVEKGQYTLPDGMSDEDFGHLREPAMNASLTQRQFGELAKDARDRKSIGAAAAADETAAAQDQIKAALGDKYDTALAHARRAAQANGIEQNWESNPEMFALLTKAGSQMTGEQAPGTGETPSPSAPPAKIAAKLRELMSTEAYNDGFHAEHESAMLAYDQLRGELSEAGYDSVFHDDLLSKHSPLRGYQDQVRPWKNPNTSIG